MCLIQTSVFILVEVITNVSKWIVYFIFCFSEFEMDVQLSWSKGRHETSVHKV